MSDYDLPDLPSDDELGITDDDLRRYGEEAAGDGPELSDDEMKALLGDPAAKGGARRGTGGEPPAGAPSADGRSGGGWRGPVTLLLLLGTCVLASTRTGLPRATPLSAPDTSFSSARAMSTLGEIARAPRPVGSPEHERVRDVLVERLLGLGLEPRIQTATSVIQAPGAARAARIRNVVARLPGTNPTGAILVTAHYDSRELSPGAADDGVGLVTILESLRALRAGQPLRNDVIVLLTDGEELGLLGSRAFVSDHPWLGDVQVVLTFEMRGGGGPALMFETGSDNGWIVEALDDFDPDPVATSIMLEVYRRMPNDTDFSPFRDLGIQGLNFAAIDRANVYHQSTDTPDRVSERTVQHHGIQALAALRHLGEADLSDVDAPNAAYFSVPVAGLIVYRSAWGYAVMVGLVVLAALTVGVAKRRGARVSAVLVGFGVALVGAALSFGAGLYLLRLTPRFHPEAGSLAAPLYHGEGWYVVAVVAAAFTVVSLLHHIGRRWLSAVELAFGGIVAPLVLAGVATFMAPLAAMTLQWPVAAALIATLVGAALGKRAAAGVGWVATILMAVPVLVMLEPIVELVWLALSFRVAPVLGVLAAVTLHLCLPALDDLRRPNAWWAPLTGAVVATAAITTGVMTAGPDADRPAPSTLVYAHEHGSPSASWVTDPQTDSTLDIEALAWASQRARSGFTRLRDLRPFGYEWSAAPSTEARVVDVSPPLVEIVRDTTTGTTRRLRVEIRSRIGAEMMGFQVDPRLGAIIRSVDGHQLDAPGQLRWVQYWGVPDPSVVLEIEVPAGYPPGLAVVEHFLRPASLLGPEPFVRPADLAPDVNAMSDRAVFRYVVPELAPPPPAPRDPSLPGFPE